MDTNTDTSTNQIFLIYFFDAKRFQIICALTQQKMQACPLAGQTRMKLNKLSEKAIIFWGLVALISVWAMPPWLDQHWEKLVKSTGRSLPSCSDINRGIRTHQIFNVWVVSNTKEMVTASCLNACLYREAQAHSTQTYQGKILLTKTVSQAFLFQAGVPM